jgi:F-type H+-transporting ATPase subunit b
MLIDWFTIGAQALNFLILVWLLKHFLYQPILGAIAAREKAVAKELADAGAKMEEATKLQAEFQAKNETFDQARADLVKKATQEAAEKRKELMEEARLAAEAMSAKRRETLQLEAVNLDKTIVDRCRQEVFAMTRKVLSDLAHASLEERMGEVFTRRLKDLDNGAKQLLGKALASDSEPAHIRSTFELPEQQQTAIRKALQETFAADLQVQFDTSPELVSGIELTAHGQKLAWSISDYLTSMEQHIGDLLELPSKPRSHHKAKPATKPAQRAT